MELIKEFRKRIVKTDWSREDKCMFFFPFGPMSRLSLRSVLGAFAPFVAIAYPGLTFKFIRDNSRSCSSGQPEKGDQHDTASKSN